MAQRSLRPTHPLLAHCVDPIKRLTVVEEVVAILVALGASKAVIGTELHLPVSSIQDRIKHLARKLPGDLAQRARIAVWARGGSLEALTGRTLRADMVLHADRWKSTAAGRRITEMADTAGV